ncbi:YceI family protein [Tenacibaculum tangerinum]|uniref:YceI family protein n=1 Tax=Tenacibaculum tangerinum TaxID=3038772 RepID=A0ABY8L9W2_9FLAO|nr:YceI family protein [Tenacibaculum tangerinum]WGH77040.1 YceI family protein [Tenacibaculum tangerinum]
MKKFIIALICTTWIPTTANAQEKLYIDVTESTIKWIGELTFHFGGHDGFVNFKEGYFIKTDDVITGGEFIIDMNSITNTDIKQQEGKDNLVNHLKDPDFFDTKKFPFAKLVITEVNYSDKTHARMKADFTLKGITKTINFRVEFNYKERLMKTRFKIDRKLWNVNYQSKLKNGFISDAIGFEVSVKL